MLISKKLGGANANPKICVNPNANPKICVTPNVRGWHWPCRFHVCVHFICVGYPTRNPVSSGIWALKIGEPSPRELIILVQWSQLVIMSIRGQFECKCMIIHLGLGSNSRTFGRQYHVNELHGSVPLFVSGPSLCR